MFSINSVVRVVPRYFAATVLILAWTALAYWVFPAIELTNLAMIYLLANVLIVVWCGEGPAVISIFLSIALFDFFFIPPSFTFTKVDERFLITFFIMFGVTLLTSRLTNRSRRSAEQALRSELVSSLLSSVSHDLRTPLASIAGAASTLMTQELELSSDNRHTLQHMIFQEAERLNGYVENLLQITRFESGNLQLNKDWNSLEEIIGSALNRSRKVLAQRKISTSIPAELPLVLVDDILIEQVFINLLDNAARYTPATAPIEIKATYNRDLISVEILDCGTGIPRKEREQIFQKFYRRQKDIQGTGLGLSICRGIVQAHGGSISVRPRDGGGSVFYFFLPLHAGGEPA